MRDLKAFLAGAFVYGQLTKYFVRWIRKGIGHGGIRDEAWQKALRGIKHDDLVSIAASFNAEVARRGIPTETFS